MLKSRIFGNSAFKRVSIYVRHGPKTNDSPNAVLTSRGRKKVLRRVQILPHDEIIIVRASPTKRTVQTAMTIAKKRRVKIQLSKELNSETLILDQQKFVNYFQHGKKWANFLRDWLDGKLNDFVIPPENVVRTVLRANELGWETQPGVFMQISHSMVLEALVEKLIGKKYERLLITRKEFSQNEIDTTEGFMLYFAKGRAKLEFRKQHFDVTKNLKRLLA